MEALQGVGQFEFSFHILYCQMSFFLRLDTSVVHVASSASDFPTAHMAEMTAETRPESGDGVRRDIW